MGDPIVGTISRAAVIGGGTMGRGIVQIIAEAGIPVTLVERGQQDIDRALAGIEKNWQRAEEKGKLTGERRADARGLISVSTQHDAVSGADFVIEAVFEDFETKRDVLTTIAPNLSKRALLATNTSSISVTALAASLSTPERVIGMHFFNPVPLMRLVEVVRGVRTSDETVERVSALATQLGKIPVVVNDFPGFVSNRVLMPMINEAVLCLGEGVATREAIDDVMKLGMAHPMGPLALADMIGLDVCLAILAVLQREIGDDKYRAAPLLRQLVAAGKLGRKTGEGFYVYSNQ